MKLTVLCSLVAIIAPTALGAMYETSIDSWEPDPNVADDLISMGTIRVTRKKRNCYIITGNFQALQNLGNDYIVYYSIKSNSGDKATLLAGKSPFCDFINMDQPIIKSVRAASNIPPGQVCPFPKGEYTIENYELTEKALPPMIPKGEYVVSAKMDSAEGRQVVAYSVFITVK